MNTMDICILLDKVRATDFKIDERPALLLSGRVLQRAKKHGEEKCKVVAGKDEYPLVTAWKIHVFVPQTLGTDNIPRIGQYYRIKDIVPTLRMAGHENIPVSTARPIGLRCRLSQIFMEVSAVENDTDVMDGAIIHGKVLSAGPFENKVMRLYIPERHLASLRRDVCNPAFKHTDIKPGTLLNLKNVTTAREPCFELALRSRQASISIHPVPKKPDVP
ncbi:MAG: hypothetical protein H6867_09100 [Rhodospirillales bacterium]|nr:hypothetical protein [Rhodospirillales bacterium]MCB9996037.1 hypothetical protein [Rhodospirillales bacterium]